MNPGDGAPRSPGACVAKECLVADHAGAATRLAAGHLQALGRRTEARMIEDALALHNGGAPIDRSPFLVTFELALPAGECQLLSRPLQ